LSLAEVTIAKMFRKICHYELCTGVAAYYVKSIVVLSQAKPRYSTEAILKTYAVFINGYMNYLFTYLLDYLLTAGSRVLLEKLTCAQLVKIFPAFYGTQCFITAFTSALHLSLS
jgi:hypothetical protein